MLVDELIKDKVHKVEPLMHNFKELDRLKNRNLKSIDGKVFFKKSNELENKVFKDKHFKLRLFSFYHIELFEKNNRKFCIIKESVIRERKGSKILNLSPLSEEELANKIKDHIIINNKSMTKVDFLKIKDEIKTIKYNKNETGFYYDDFLKKKNKIFKV